MQAKQLHEVLARVVAWHNRHPLALRISPQQVHSIGGVALPFASDVRPAEPPPPPALGDVLDPAAGPDEAMASFLAAADAGLTPDGVAETGTAPVATPPDETPADAHAAPEPPAEEAGEEPATEPLEEPRNETAADPAPSDAVEPEPAAEQPDDNAPIELAMALDEVAAQADAAAAAAMAASQPTDAAPDAAPEAAPEESADDSAPAAPPSDDPGEAPTQVLTEPAPDADAAPTDSAAGVDASVDPHAAAAEHAPAEPGADAPLAERLQAARERAMAAGSAPPLDLALDASAHAAPVPAATTAAATAVAAGAAPASRRNLLARLWAGLPLGWLRRRGAGKGPGSAPAAGAGQGRLAPLFSQDFMWPRTPREVARWVQRHGSEQPLAPADWPQRQVESDAALLQAARRKGMPHAVTRHVLTAAIGVGDRRIRLLIDADGHILGPRAFDRRRIGLIGSAGTALAGVALVAVLGPWRHAARHDDGEAAAHAEAAASAASAASVAMASASAASAAAEASHTEHAEHAEPATPAGHDAPAEAHAAAQPAAPAAPTPAGHAAPAAPAAAAGHGAHGADAAPGDGHGHAQASGHGEAADTDAATATAAATTAASAPVSVVKITHEPPPRWPNTRASGPLVAIRMRLSDEAKQAARAEVAAAREAMRGEPLPKGLLPKGAATAAQPVQAPAAPPRLGPQETAVRVAQQPGTVYAVVTPAMPQRESAEAILAQMMSVRARLSPTAPDHGEVMSHQGRWRAVWLPFTTAAEAERARAMLVARGMRAEVVEF